MPFNPKTILTSFAVFTLVACGAPAENSGSSNTSSSMNLPALSVTQSRQEARQVFGYIDTASQGASAAYGGYANGCVAGAEQLAETGPTWQAMRLSRNRNWAHPETVDFVQDLSREVARSTSWAGIYVGDMSQPRGGPMLSGHRSHQSGLDADIWLRPARDLSLSRDDRENISSISMRRSSGAYVNSEWTEDHWRVVRAAASDPRVARIFIFPGAKVWMCDNETGDRSYLRNIRPWYGHHYHFHVRLSCPAGSRGCQDQDAPPRGDGCDEAREWVSNILSPPPPDPNAPPPAPRRELTMGDLPRQCAALVQG